MVVLCYTNYLVVFGSPKCFWKIGEPVKHFCAKNSEIKSLKLLRKGNRKIDFGEIFRANFFLNIFRCFLKNRRTCETKFS